MPKKSDKDRTSPYVTLEDGERDHYVDVLIECSKLTHYAADGLRRAPSRRDRAVVIAMSESLEHLISTIDTLRLRVGLNNTDQQSE